MKAVPHVDKGVTTGFLIFCPGCNTGHLFSTLPDRKPCWTFNGDQDRPTFSPSMLVRVNDPSHKNYQKHAASSVCHSFVRNGKIEFLNDCTHPLKGQTVDLPDVPGTEGLPHVEFVPDHPEKADVPG